MVRKWEFGGREVLFVRIRADLPASFMRASA